MKHAKTLTALIVGGAETATDSTLPTLLKQQGYDTIIAQNPAEAIACFRHQKTTIVLIDVTILGADCEAISQQIKTESGDHFIPIIFIINTVDEASLDRYIQAGSDDFLIKPYDSFSLKVKMHALQRTLELNQKNLGLYSILHREQEIAESLFVNAIQGTNIKNSQINSTIRPATTFSGDMILSAYSPIHDLFFLIGDFTGHGLAAALGAMPVSEVFHAMTAKGFSAEKILVGIHKKLRALLPTGMFFGVQLVVIKQNFEHLLVFNAGMPDLLIVDGVSNQIKQRVKSAGLPLGVVASINPKEIAQIYPINEKDKILMMSDGVTEARNPADQEFGDLRLQQTIIEAPQNRVYTQILERLDQFCENTSQADDVTLVEISCTPALFAAIQSHEPSRPARSAIQHRGEWKMSMEFQGACLTEINPVPILMSHILEMEELEKERGALFTVMTELYMNALDHGVLNLDSLLKEDSNGFSKYFEIRESRLQELQSGHIIFDLTMTQKNNFRSLKMRVEDSGAGFNYQQLRAPNESNPLLHGRGILLVEELCESLVYEGRGNIAKVHFSWE